MDKHKENDRDNGICTVPQGVIQYPSEVMEMREYNSNLFHKVYREISEKIGIEAALTIHQMFKGTQVSFPVKFFDAQAIREMIVKEYNGENAKMLARKYGYSEKSVRRIIKDSAKRKSRESDMF